MSYAIKECLLTLQGEGVRSGRVIVLCRMSGCNLWSGSEADRATAACSLCDTDFVGTNGAGGGKFRTAQELATHIAQAWAPAAKGDSGARYVVFTGGEPLLQLDAPLVDACHELGFEVGIETNGTLPAPRAIDWICVSPKSSNALAILRGNELKLVYPQVGVPPEAFEHLAFEHWLLQPLDGPERNAATRACIDYCLSHPRWRLSVQLHKMLGIP